MDIVDEINKAYAEWICSHTNNPTILLLSKANKDKLTATVDTYTDPLVDVQKVPLILCFMDLRVLESSKKDIGFA